MSTQFTAPNIVLPPNAAPARDDEISLVAIANILLRGFWCIIAGLVLGLELHRRGEDASDQVAAIGGAVRGSGRRGATGSREDEPNQRERVSHASSSVACRSRMR